MAQFKVNDRVKVVGQIADCARDGLPYVGRTGTVTGTGRQPNFFGTVMDYGVNIDGIGACLFMAHHLAPLLPPDEAADAFLARLKKLGSEPVNDAPKVKVEAK